MCVMSMVMDHYYDKWRIAPRPDYFGPPTFFPPPAITPEEIKEFRELLERAREYDKRHAQPDCELESKKERVKKLAEELGVKIDFL